MATSLATSAPGAVKLLNPQTSRTLNSYLFWLLFLLGLGGAHRIYNGKIWTGLLWFCTWGFFGVGQMVDLFLIPDMVEEQRIRMLRRAGLKPEAATLAITGKLYNPTTREQWQMQLLQAAQKLGGSLTVPQAVMTTGLGFEQAEEILKEMHLKGYVSIDNHPETGVVTYHFIGL